MSDVNEFNAITGEEVLRPFTAKELKQYKLDTRVVEPEKVELPIDPIKASAIAKLEALGLNLNEAQAIIGQ